jgi:type IV pilus assembly protein PilA
MIKYQLTLEFLKKNRCKNNQGFTLIELLVVVIIIGILSAVALPSLFKQVEKSRQAEAKVILGNLNRAQQAYRFEKGTFTTITNLPIAITGKFYTFASVGTPDSQGAVHIATVVNTFENDLKDFSSATGQTASGVFTGVVCEQNSADGATAPIPATVSTGTPSCSSGTTQIF